MNWQRVKSKWKYWSDFDYWFHRINWLYWINPRYLKHRFKGWKR